MRNQHTQLGRVGRPGALQLCSLGKTLAQTTLRCVLIRVEGYTSFSVTLHELESKVTRA
jgi:hypothetical protein